MGRASQTATETGPGGGAIVYAPIGGADVSSCNANAYTTVASGGALTTQASCSGTDQKNAFAKDLGSIAAGRVALVGRRDAVRRRRQRERRARTAWSTFLGGKTRRAALHRRCSPSSRRGASRPRRACRATETAIWRQAETVLRMGQIREPYTDSPRRHNNGMILASLPPGGWHTGWVRDATYAVVALARSGHADEAKLALDFFLNADAGRYPSFVGEPAVPDQHGPLLRRRPGGGRLLGLADAQHRDRRLGARSCGPRASYVDASARHRVARSRSRRRATPSTTRSRAASPSRSSRTSSRSGMAIADASIWEVHWGNRQHFLYTTATAARGLCDMATLARRAGKTADVERYRDARREGRRRR